MKNYNNIGLISTATIDDKVTTKYSYLISTVDYKQDGLNKNCFKILNTSDNTNYDSYILINFKMNNGQYTTDFDLLPQENNTLFIGSTSHPYGAIWTNEGIDYKNVDGNIGVAIDDNPLVTSALYFDSSKYKLYCIKNQLKYDVDCKNIFLLNYDGTTISFGNDSIVIDNNDSLHTAKDFTVTSLISSESLDINYTISGDFLAINHEVKTKYLKIGGCSIPIDNPTPVTSNLLEVNHNFAIIHTTDPVDYAEYECLNWDGSKYKPFWIKNDMMINLDCVRSSMVSLLNKYTEKDTTASIQYIDINNNKKAITVKNNGIALTNTLDVSSSTDWSLKCSYDNNEESSMYVSISSKNNYISDKDFLIPRDGAISTIGKNWPIYKGMDLYYVLSDNLEQYIPSSGTYTHKTMKVGVELTATSAPLKVKEKDISLYSIPDTTTNTGVTFCFANYNNIDLKSNFDTTCKWDIQTPYGSPTIATDTLLFSDLSKSYHDPYVTFTFTDADKNSISVDKILSYYILNLIANGNTITYYYILPEELKGNICGYISSIKSCTWEDTVSYNGVTYEKTWNSDVINETDVYATYIQFSDNTKDRYLQLHFNSFDLENEDNDKFIYNITENSQSISDILSLGTITNFELDSTNHTINFTTDAEIAPELEWD